MVGKVERGDACYSAIERLQGHIIGEVERSHVAISVNIQVLQQGAAREVERGERACRLEVYGRQGSIGGQRQRSEITIVDLQSLQSGASGDIECRNAGHVGRQRLQLRATRDIECGQLTACGTAVIECLQTSVRGEVESRQARVAGAVERGETGEVTDAREVGYALVARIHRGRRQTLVAREVTVGVEITIRGHITEEVAVGEVRAVNGQPRVRNVRPIGGVNAITCLRTAGEGKSCGGLYFISIGKRVTSEGLYGLCRTFHDEGGASPQHSQRLVEGRDF